MDRPFLMALVLAVLLILLALMLIGWRRRQHKQAGLPRPLGLPEHPGHELMTATGYYVATTIAGEPLNRVAVAGLGYRALATVGVTELGLALAIPGQSTIFVPATGIRSVDRATWTIDRVVERDGLVLVRWMLGDAGAGQVEVDSYLRFADDAAAALFFEEMQRVRDSVAETTTTAPSTTAPSITSQAGGLSQ